MNEPGMQSALHAAAGSSAALLHELGLVLYAGGALLFAAVIALALRGVFSDAKDVDERHWVVGAGIVMPVTVLATLLLYALAVGSAVSDMSAHGPLRILLDCFSRGSRALTPSESNGDVIRVEVVGRDWWWEVRYVLRRGEERGVVLANELHLPVGQPLPILLSSDDVIHSLWVPSLAGKADMIPGRVNRLVLRASEPGLHRGQCAEYCGAQHALMALYVVVEPAADFDAWLKRQAAPARMPDDPFLQQGYDAFMRSDCVDCHTVRGTPARGEGGPDLTHVGSRLSIAAGVLSNHSGTMAGWIAGAQDVKRDNHMPSARGFAGQELRALAAWLESLE
jgi:cytochrome c oxidase subunit 2